MALELLERPTTPTDTDSNTTPHECATCRHKERVYLTSPDGKRTAAVWRCRTLSQKTQKEVLVQPQENCFAHRSLTDYWQPTARDLVR